MEPQQTSKCGKVTRTTYYRRRIDAYKKHLRHHPNDVSFRQLHIPDEWRQRQQNELDSSIKPGGNEEDGLVILDNVQAEEFNVEVFDTDPGIIRNDQSDNRCTPLTHQRVNNICHGSSSNSDENCINITDMQHIHRVDETGIQEFESDEKIDDQRILGIRAKSYTSHDSGDNDKNYNDDNDNHYDDDDDDDDYDYDDADDDDDDSDHDDDYDYDDGDDEASEEKEDDDFNDVDHDSENNDSRDEATTFSYPEVQETLDALDRKQRGFCTIEEGRDWSRKMEMRTDVTKLHVVATVIATALRGRHTYESTVRMLKNLDSMLWDSKLPRTKKSLWSLLGRNDEIATTRHMYCRVCNSIVGEGKEPNKDCECDSRGLKRSNKQLSYFIEIKIEPQLRQILSNPRNVTSLRYRFTREKKDADCMEDIYDSTEYKKKCEPGEFLNNENNYSFTLNTDGCKVTNSANTSAWPIMLHINEFPPHARKRHTILAGIWVDDYHPNLQAVLLPTVKELNHLYRDGIVWTNPVDNTTITSKFTTLVCTVDSKARPEVLNMTHMNGEYGCTFCYAKGQHIPGAGVKRTYPVENGIIRRTHDEIVRNMKEAHQTNQKVAGIKGMSVLAILHGFDLSVGMVVDCMHNVYLGVAKLHTCLLLFGKASNRWYAGTPNNLAIINLRLLKIRPPSKISRKPRAIQDRNNWKATEWRNWILYYALPCLEGIVRTCDLEHLALLSRAAYIFNKDCIGTQELEEARLLLKQYVKQFQDIFGIGNMRYNIHLLTHLTDTVKSWGPFWAHSTFPFESWNKKIIDNVTSSNSRPLQIATRYLMYRFIEGLIDDPNVSRRTKNTIRSTLYDDVRTQNITEISEAPLKVRGIGNVENRPPCRWESQALLTAGFQPEVASFYKRALILHNDYRCRENANTKTTRFCNKFVYCQSIGFAEILEFIRFHHNGELICGLLVALMPSVGNVFGARHIQNVTMATGRSFINISDDTPAPAIIIEIHDRFHAIKLANVWETD